jgi:multiple sugar transport system substrate-binding protein
MNRKSIGLVICLLVPVSMLFAACGPMAAPEPEMVEAVVEGETVVEEVGVTVTATTPPPEAPETLRVWIQRGNDPEQIQELFDQYAVFKGIQIEITSPIDDESDIISGLSGPEPPDVLVVSDPVNVSTWAGEGLLFTLDRLIERYDIDLDDIYPAMLAGGTYQGMQYALPWGSHTYALYWNKRLFEEAGLNPERPPKTTDEMLEYADALAKFDADGTITQLGFVPDFSSSHLEQYAAVFGGYFVNADGTHLRLTSQPVVDALRWEQEFYTRYGPEEVLRFVSSFGDYASAEHGFIDEKVAMMVDGEWFTGDDFIGRFGPELSYGVAPIPYPTGHPELAGTNVVAGPVAVIPSGVKDLDGSGELLAWMMSPEIVAEVMVARFCLPSSMEAAEDPRFHHNEKFAKFMELANSPNAASHILTPISGEILSELELIEQQVLHTGADPEPLLEEAQERLQKMLYEALSQ